jgi:hypothetical protein
MSHEELIAACMETEGFEYSAVLTSDVYVEEAVERAEDRGETVDETLSTLVIPANPNDQYTQGLSESDLAAYQAAIWGDGIRSGCFYSTYEEAWGILPEALAPDPDRDENIESAVAADPRTIAAESDFVACMAKEGFTFESVQALLEYPAALSDETARLIDDAGREQEDGANPEYERERHLLDAYNAAYSPCADSFYAVADPVRQEIIDSYDSP